MRSRKPAGLEPAHQLAFIRDRPAHQRWPARQRIGQCQREIAAVLVEPQVRNRAAPAWIHRVAQRQRHDQDEHRRHHEQHRQAVAVAREHAQLLADQREERAHQSRSR
jgi:hypothetical protein